MLKALKALPAVALIAMTAAPALAQDAAVLSPGNHEFTLYEKVSGWTIYRDMDSLSGSGVHSGKP